MPLLGFERETLLDLTVNVIPAGIILVFVAAFAALPAFGVDPVMSTLQFSLLLVPLVGLLILSYYTGKAIEADERAHEADAIEERAE